MTGVRVKICGIKTIEDIFIATGAGTDAVGFVVDVPSSPRNLSINDARNLIRATPIFTKTIAVTVPEDLIHLKKIYEELNPDILQVHGFYSSCKEIRQILPNTSLIGAFQVTPDFNLSTLLEDAVAFDAILLDSHANGMFGGTGRLNDFILSKKVKEAIHPKPLILAGGLKPENVEEAISIVRPYAVDVSSGVESVPGIKDKEKVLEFIKRAKGV